MNQNQIKILDHLLDDHYALWDFADSFPKCRPDAPQSTVNDVINLLRDGYIIITFGVWQENETTPVNLASAEPALLDPLQWQPTGRQPGFAIELTEEGTQFLRGLGIGLPAD